MDFSPDDRYFVVARRSGKVERWDRSTYRVKDTYTFSTTVTAYCVRYSRDGKYIAVSGNTSDVDILNATTLTKINFLPTGMNWVFSVDFRYDNQVLIAAGSDSELQVWGVPSWTLVDSYPTSNSRYYAVSYAPDGKFVAGGFNSLSAFN